MVTGRGLRLVHIVTVALAVALVSGIGFELWTRDGSMLPPPSWLSVLLVVVMAGLIIVVAWPIRVWRAGRSTKRLDPLRAARVLVLAQAAALTGGAVFGWYVGHLAVLLPDLSLMAYRRQLWVLVAILGSCVVLIAAGLVVQHWCRLDQPGDPDNHSREGRG